MERKPISGTSVLAVVHPCWGAPLAPVHHSRIAYCVLEHRIIIIIIIIIFFFCRRVIFSHPLLNGCNDVSLDPWMLDFCQGRKSSHFLQDGGPGANSTYYVSTRPPVSPLYIQLPIAFWDFLSAHLGQPEVLRDTPARHSNQDQTLYPNISRSTVPVRLVL